VIHLRHNIMVVGPDRCFKSTLCQNLLRYVDAPLYHGYRGDDAIVAPLFEFGPPRIWDRVLLCDRAYDELLGRSVLSLEIAAIKERTERIIAESNDVYVHLTRRSFVGVQDDVNTQYDLGELSKIYFRLLSRVPNEVRTMYVDNVTSADINTDPEWVRLVGQVLDFIYES
jgi:hypothetical protein